MDEYINREAFLKWAREFYPNDKVFASAIINAPTADVAPVAHGRWEDSIDEWFGTDVYTCSKCRESYVLVEGTPKQNLWHYCPNCGAKMDGGDSDAAD